jgi:hypothetical protein
MTVGHRVGPVASSAVGACHGAQMATWLVVSLAHAEGGTCIQTRGADRSAPVGKQSHRDTVPYQWTQVAAHMQRHGTSVPDPGLGT